MVGGCLRLWVDGCLTLVGECLIVGGWVASGIQFVFCWVGCGCLVRGVWASYFMFGYLFNRWVDVL